MTNEIMMKVTSEVFYLPAASASIIPNRIVFAFFFVSSSDRGGKKLLR
jgi:hypothetical protein